MFVDFGVPAKILALKICPTATYVVYVIQCSTSAIHENFIPRLYSI